MKGKQKGLFFVVSGPAGVGKTTLIQRLMQELPEVQASVSFTTREPRLGEIEGVHYHFINHLEFEAKISADHFLEYVKLYGTYYGTSREWVEEKLREGKHVVLVIDTQGAMQLKDKIKAAFIFIQPPSFEVLRKRLLLRKTENAEVIEKRLEWAEKEIAAADSYDYQLANDQFEEAFQVLRCIFIAEFHRTRCEKNQFTNLRQES